MTATGSLENHVLCIQVCSGPRQCAQGDHIGFGPCGTQCLPVGMARATQQKLQYALYGTASNHFNEQVFLRYGLHLAAEVQKHLGLVGPHEHKRFMDM